MESTRIRYLHTSLWGIWNRTSERSEQVRFLILYQRVWKSRTKRFPCCNLLILYILRFSHQILLCGKVFRILLRPIREVKQFLFHKREICFTSLIGRSKIWNAFSQSKFDTKISVWLYEINNGCLIPILYLLEYFSLFWMCKTSLWPATYSNQRKLTQET